MNESQFSRPEAANLINAINHGENIDRFITPNVAFLLGYILENPTALTSITHNFSIVSKPNPSEPPPTNVHTTRDKVELVDESRMLKLDGKPHILTPGQFAVVKVLLDAYKSGHYPLKGEKLIRLANLTRRVSDVFGSDHPNHWMIKRIGQDLYYLSFLPPDQAKN